MKFIERFYLDFARLFPRKYRNHLKKQFIYAGLKTEADLWLGSLNLVTILFFIIIIILPWSIFNYFQIIYLIIAFFLFFLIHLASYLLVYFKVEDRTKRIEEALPDFLQLISSNLKAGMTPFQALKHSSREEFGPLKEEISYATSRALGTGSFIEVLLTITKRVKSELFERSMKLFTTAMKSGGHLAVLLEELSRDMAETRSLKKELVTNTKTYSAFIMFTIVFGTPLLLSIGVRFVEMITEIQAKVPEGVGFGVGFLVGEIAITAPFLTKVSVALLIITSLLASMLMGVIREGKAKTGFRRFPFIAIACIVIFIITRILIAAKFA